MLTEMSLGFLGGNHDSELSKSLEQISISGLQAKNGIPDGNVGCSVLLFQLLASLVPIPLTKPHPLWVSEGMANPLENALQRGKDFWTKQESVSDSAIYTMLGLRLAFRAYRHLIRTPEGLYPVWQFHNGKVVRGLLEVLTILRSKELGNADCASFFLNHNPYLQAIPIEYLRSGGDLCLILEAAMSFHEHGAT